MEIRRIGEISETIKTGRNKKIQPRNLNEILIDDETQEKVKIVDVVDISPEARKMQEELQLQKIREELEEGGNKN